MYFLSLMLLLRPQPFFFFSVKYSTLLINDVGAVGFFPVIFVSFTPCFFNRSHSNKANQFCVPLEDPAVFFLLNHIVLVKAFLSINIIIKRIIRIYDIKKKKQ